MARNMTIDELAGIIKGEFDNVGGEIKGIKGEVREIKSEMMKGFKEIKDDHEKLELKMSNVAYRFELVELQKRVEFVEKRVLRK